MSAIFLFLFATAALVGGAGLLRWLGAWQARIRRVPEGLVELPPRALGAAVATHGHMLVSQHVSRSMGGERDGVPVRIDEIPAGKYSSLVFEVGRLTSRITLRRQTLADDMVDGPAYQVHLGENAFDRAVLVRGDDAALYALLDADTRQLVLDATRRDLVIGDGAIVWVTSGSYSRADVLDQHFALVRALVSRLSVPETSWDDRLAERAGTDPAPLVRLGALTCLATRDLPRGRTLSRALGADPKWTSDVARALLPRHAETRESLTAPLRRVLPDALDPVDAALVRLDAGLALETTGLVSIAEGEGGELALAKEAGAVSVVRERDG